MLVYLNFCLTGALNGSIMTYYLALSFSVVWGKNLIPDTIYYVFVLLNSLSDIQTSREPIMLLPIIDISVHRAF